MTTHAPGALPVPLTTLIGREREVADACSLLRRDGVRIVTLTGPGGTGKTRLSLQVADELRSDFSDGIAFISLATIVEPTLVVSAIGLAVGVREEGEQALDDRLVDALAEKRLLLILDNFEQVTTAGPRIADLLSSCPGVKALVTSRAALHVRGERELPVPALAIPDPKHLPPLAEVAVYPAITLFLERAQAVRPDLELTADNAATIAEICARLDGLPLAIELAAARIKLLPPVAMLPRLAHRLSLLTGGARDLPTRLQTMRNAIAWSYDLLTEEERILFRRIAVFGGGFTLDAAEAVAGEKAGGREGEDVLDGVSALVDHSLLRQVDSIEDAGTVEPRFTMLETIREFAAERLADAGEEAVFRRLHADYFADLAAAADPALLGPEQRGWLHRLDAEYDNLRAALAWTIDQGDTRAAQALAASLRRFWEVRGHLSEGRGWLDRTLALGDATPHPARAKALLAAAALARKQGDYPRAVALYEESLGIWRALGDGEGIASAVNNLGVLAHERGDYDRANGLYAEALDLFRGLGDREKIAASLLNLGIVARRQGEYERAMALYEESLALQRALGDQLRVALVLNNLGVVAYSQGDHGRAADLYEEALAVWRELDDRGGMALSLHNLAETVRDQGELARAASLEEESLRFAAEQGDRSSIAECLTGLAGIAARVGLPERAARLFAAADAIRTAIGVALPPSERERQERGIAHARGLLPAATFAANWEAGRAMTVEQALAYVVEGAAETAAAAAAQPRAEPESPAEAAGLTKREIDVLRLIVEGMSDREIGEALFISHRTAMTHVTNILNKLGVNSRTAAAAVAVRQGLV